MNNIRGIYKHANRWEARFKVGVDEKTGRAKYRSVYAQSCDEVIAKRNAILGELFEASKVAASRQMNLLILGAGMLGRDVYDIAALLRVFKRISFLDDAAVGEASIGDFSIIASNGVVSSGARVGSFSHIDCGAIVQQRAHVKESTWVRSGEIYGDKL